MLNMDFYTFMMKNIKGLVLAKNLFNRVRLGIQPKV